MRVEIRVLGGLSVQLSTRTLRLGTPKQQAIFAMLTVQPGRLVTVDDLVDELWADRPPRSAIANVRTYAANLRRTFEASPAGRGVIERQRNGYRLVVDPDRVDVFRFEVERNAGREAVSAGDLDDARRSRRPHPRERRREALTRPNSAYRFLIDRPGNLPDVSANGGGSARGQSRSVDTHPPTGHPSGLGGGSVREERRRTGAPSAPRVVVDATPLLPSAVVPHR
ncbi:winged helix-turn-helix domain-containing protein [Micromonospora taraxaci]|uniref:AfsR/SARP family transcriptional regulator n=1 Tax=Micromonospora taraxaci TaxID=1316803 RepID=UPI0033D59FEF